MGGGRERYYKRCLKFLQSSYSGKSHKRRNTNMYFPSANNKNTKNYLKKLRFIICLVKLQQINYYIVGLVIIVINIVKTFLDEGSNKSFKHIICLMSKIPQ